MKKALLCLIVSVVGLMALALPVLANGRGRQSVLAKDTTINRDYFAAGSKVELSGTVNGDVYAAGGQVMVDGIVNGDLLVTGGNVNVSGKVAGNIRAAGGNVNIAGAIGRNLTVVGGNVTVSSGATLSGSLVAMGGSVVIEAPVAGNVKLAGGDTTIAAAVSGDVEAAVGQLRLTSKASVSGNLTYVSSSNASIDPGAKVAGQTIKKSPPARKTGAPTGRIFSTLWMLGTLLTGLILVWMVPGYGRTLATNLRRKPLAALGWGAATFFLAPILVVVLMITIIGIPLGLVALALYLIALYFSPIVAMLALGLWGTERYYKKANLALSLVAGLLVLWLIFLLPVIGGIVGFVSLLLGLGSITMTKRQLLRRRGDQAKLPV